MARLEAAACYLSVLIFASFRDAEISAEASKRTRDVTGDVIRTRDLPRYNLLASDDGQFITFRITIVIKIHSRSSQSSYFRE